MLQVVTTADQLRSVTEIATSVTTAETAWAALSLLENLFDAIQEASDTGCLFFYACIF